MWLRLGGRARALAGWLGLMLVVVLPGSPSLVLAARTDPGTWPGVGSSRAASDEVHTILSVLEPRLGNALTERVRAKLATLDPKRLRLIASLTERIADKQTVGADVGLLVVVALIVLD